MQPYPPQQQEPPPSPYAAPGSPPGYGDGYGAQPGTGYGALVPPGAPGQGALAHPGQAGSSALAYPGQPAGWPAPLPPAKRGYGIVVLVGAGLWGVLAAVGSILYVSTLLALVSALSGAEEDFQAPADVSSALAVTYISFIVTLVLVLGCVVLDIVAVVQSIRRLALRIGDAVVPWIVLVEITVCWLGPAISIAVIAVALGQEWNEVAAGGAVVLFLLIFGAVPLGRFIQLIVGIVRTAMGERPRPRT